MEQVKVVVKLVETVVLPLIVMAAGFGYIGKSILPFFIAVFSGFVLLFLLNLANNGVFVLTEKRAHYLGLINLGLIVFFWEGTVALFIAAMTFFAWILPIVREEMSNGTRLAGLTLIILGLGWLVGTRQGRKG